MNKSNWWNKHARIIQTNLRVTDIFDPEELTDQIRAMYADVLVINVGGIYAWYPTKIPYHTLNPFLPEGRDLIKELSEACQRKNIRLVARCDFSKAEDKTFLEHPEWFIRLPDHKPQIVGMERPGNWPLLMSTCPNSGYQNEEVAFPVLREMLSHYPLDGIFINSMFYAPCQCKTCRDLYRNEYGKELPVNPADCEPSWFDFNIKRSLESNRKVIKDINPEVAFFDRFGLQENKFDPAQIYKQTGWWFTKSDDFDCLFENPPDVLHSETHDGLCSGVSQLSYSWMPAASTNLGLFLCKYGPPVDIAHTAPGLLWRHVNLPPAEHAFWISQIPANGGSVWHSMSGIPATQNDKRVNDTITWFNKKAIKSTEWMSNAVSAAQVALAWNGDSGHSWVEVLTENQIPYRLFVAKHISEQALFEFTTVIFPEKTKWDTEMIRKCTAYVQQGGRLLLEGEIPDELQRMAGTKIIGHSEQLLTAYTRFEDVKLQAGLEEMEILPFSGEVVYCKAGNDTAVLCTLVPPFSPPNGAGSPPERAVIPVEKTNIPMAVLRRCFEGQVMHIPFSLGALVSKTHMEEHYRFAYNVLDILLSDKKIFEFTRFPGVQFTAFHSKNTYILHFINGVGARPLRKTVPLKDMCVAVVLPAEAENVRVTSVLQDKALSLKLENGKAFINFDLDETWEIIVLRWGGEE